MGRGETQDMAIDREKYELDLLERQRVHLQNVYKREWDWKPCAHDQCSQCHGTGVKSDGASCVHCLSCDCPKCSPRC